MIHLRKLLLTALLVLSITLIHAQIIGGRGNGESTPKDVQASEITSGGFSGDVSLFSGTFNSSYSLGTVSTPDGISFNASISYSSSYSTGSNQPHSSGIPYGEGWNLDLPSISITTEDYNKYTLYESNRMNNNPTTSPYTKSFTTNELHEEGELYWFAPTLNIPGVASGRMVFKGYKYGDNPVFVLHKFDRYVEAVFRGDSWEIQLDDGTIFYFTVTKANYRNASNQRVSLSATSDANALTNNILPKAEILSWYITEIYHPNKEGRIHFKYQRFGAFDYFKEYKQPRVRQAFHAYSTVILDNPNPAYDPTLIVSTAGNPALLTVAYKDIYLEEISTGYEKLVFKHESIPTHNGTALLHLWDSDVSRKDSLYSYKTVYSWGVNGTHGFDAVLGTNYSPWKRYHHMRSDLMSIVHSPFGYHSLSDMSRSTNPYVGEVLTGPAPNTDYLIAEKLTSTDASYPSFNHSYFESPRIGKELPPGDIYEIKTAIHNANTSNSQDGFINFDINIASGEYDYSSSSNILATNTFNDGNSNTINIEYPRADYYDLARKETIFSTFNQPIKWNSLGTTATVTETSNFFTMPNLPNQYGGFHIQVGPGNSDNKMNLFPGDTYDGIWDNQGGSVIPNHMPNPGFSYYGRDVVSESSFDNTANANGMRSGDNIPNNFGLGLPWRMMFDFYKHLDSKIDYFDVNNNTSISSYSIWWNHEDLNNAPISSFNHDNHPTLADDNVQLQSVELVRYAKNPYMLRYVEHYKTSDDNAAQALQNNDEDAWFTLISRKQFNYEIDVVENYLYAVEVTGPVSNRQYHLRAFHKGDRNVFLLTNIKELPVNGVAYNEGTVPTTHFEYDTTNHVSGTQTYSLSQGVSEVTITDIENSMMLLSNKALLNKVITPLGGETVIEYDWNETYFTPLAKNTPRGGMFNGNPQPTIVAANDFAVQVNMVVKSKTINDRSGATKRWDYQFGSLLKISNRMPLQENYAYDLQYNYSKGFTSATVYQPELTPNNRPYTKYYHHTINTNYNTGVPAYSMFWGKLYKIEYYDGDDNLLSKNETTYEFSKAFKSRYLRKTGSNSYNVDYQDYIFNYQNNFIGTDVAKISGFWGGQHSYESKEYQSITNYSQKPGFLDSYFIRVKQEKNTTYDKSCQNCEASNEGETSQENLTAPSCEDFIETITDYEYFDADYKGVSSSEGYKKVLQYAYDMSGLQNANLVYPEQTQLMHEPSWQLYKTKTYSPQLPDAYTEEEYFYIYDLVNDIPYLNSSFDEIDANFELLYKVYAKGMRNLAMEKRTTTKAAGQAPKTSTDYYVYETGWDNATGSMTSFTTIGMTEQTLYANNHPCPTPPSFNLPPGCFVSQNSNLYNGAYNPTHCLSYIIPEGYVYCPCGNTATSSSPTGMISTGDMMAGRVWLRSTHTSTVSTYPSSDPTAINTEHDAMYFDNSNNFEPVFNVDVIKTYEVLSRTPMGWVYEEADEKGLVTRYDYVPSTMITFYYCDGYNEHTKTIYGSENFGSVSKVTVGLGTVEPLITNYTYNANGTIATITNPNGILLSYDYDEYNRMTKAYRNGDLLAASNYSKWDNDDGLATPTTFEQRTMQNYVETIQYNDLTGTNYAASRAFVDPLGRNTMTAAHISTAPNDLIVSAYTMFDSWDRPIHNYKPFELTTSNGFNSLNYNTPQSNINSSTPKTTQVYEDDPRSRVLKAAKFGLDITSNHIVETGFCILDGEELKSELGLSNASMADWMQDAYSVSGRIANKFLKSTIEDEDDKQVIEYGNAIGQKIATLRYDDSGQKVVTLFFYDSRGNLIEVINPENQSSYYLYNDLGQLYEKQTIDGGYTRYIYNKSGQLVLEQDANGAANSYVRGYTYDIMGRTTEQNRLDCSINPFANFSATNSLSWKNSTMNTSYISSTIPEKRWYYGLSFNTNNATILAQAKDYLNHSLTGTIGQLTHTISYDHRGTPIEYRFFSYNSEGLPKWEITQFNQNGIEAGQLGLMVRIDFAEYSLQGSLLTQNIDLDGNRTFDFQYHYTYDEWSRLKEIYISYNNQKANGYKVAEYQYNDALGLVEQLTYYDSKSNTCKNYPVDQIIYTYDIRDRLTQIQSNLFDWMLFYDANSPSIVLAQQNWNGNINGTRADYKFGTSGLTITNLSSVSNFTNHKYTDYVYTYDKLNRLTAADAALHNGSLVNGSIGDVTYSYDKIGNLLSLTRTDQPQTTTYTYNYQSVTNKMVGITASVGLNVIGNYTYNYDNNGNLTYDSKRDVTVTKYGRENLPANLSTTNHNLMYLYDIADLRIYKNEADKGRGGLRSAEWYLRAGGKEIAIYDMNQGELTWYIHGSKRIAKLKHQLNDGTETLDIIGGSFADDTDTYETEDEERVDELERLVETDQNGETFLELPDKLLYVEYSDDTKEYILESRVNGDYTVLSFIELVEPSQQLVFTTDDGEVITISLEELVGLLDDLPLGSTFAGYDPFDIPMTLVTNAPTPNLVYYVYDYLGNTRVTYSTAVECDASVTYTIEAVVDYFPYGKELRSYYNEGQEKYLTTQHERDIETGLDYRGARLYDADIVRFLSLDPLAQDYPSFSDYVYVANNPISFVDPDGKKVQPPLDEDDDGPSMQAFNNLKAAYLAASKNEELSETDRTRYKERYDDLVRMEKVTDIVYVVDISGDDKMPATGFNAFLAASTDKNLNTSSNKNPIYVDVLVSEVADGDAKVFLADELEHARQVMDGELGFNMYEDYFGNLHSSVQGYDGVDEMNSQDASIDAANALGIPLTSQQKEYLKNKNAYLVKYYGKGIVNGMIPTPANIGKSKEELKKYIGKKNQDGYEIKKIIYRENNENEVIDENE